ncbi:hypothetical protein BH11BAC7_BH11BAC7_24250 [soil metagenome]
MKKLYPLLFCSTFFFAAQNTFAQCGPTISCPANITANSTTGICGAIVNYPPATATTTCTGSTTIFSETFQAGVGAWTINVNTGTNAGTPNSWEVNASEGGVAPPGCGVANNGDLTLHITCTSAFCGSLITGAVYNANKVSNKRAESPAINSTGYSNLTLNFDFISVGDALLDNASVVYNDGSGWQVLTASIKSIVCGNGQGQWTAYSATLPSSCNNNPNLKIGFNWTNNADNAGSDPSIAINNITITAPSAVTPVITYNYPTGSLFSVGTTTVTAIATDPLNNADTCSFLITVNDIESPAINSCPSDITIAANNTGCTAIVNWTAPTATDNCAGPSLTSTHNSGSAFPAGTTTVTYTATDASGNSVSCSFNVTVFNNLAVTINSTMGTLECEGTTDTLIASGALTYSWSTSTTNDTLVVVQTPAATQWIVTGTDENGCSNSDTINVTVSALTAITMNMNPIDTQCVFSVSVNLANAGSPAGGTWTGPGVNALSFDPVSAGVGTHTLTYSVTNLDGCSSTATGTIYVDICTGMSNVADENPFILYPNPNNGNFILETKETALVEIYNSIGELVLTQNSVAGKNSLSLENAANGIYLVKISTDGEVKFVRVVKEN